MKIENYINNLTVYISYITEKKGYFFCISPINYNLSVLVDFQLSHMRHSLLRCNLLSIDQ